jgi:hypothetical protein
MPLTRAQGHRQRILFLYELVHGCLEGAGALHKGACCSCGRGDRCAVILCTSERQNPDAWRLGPLETTVRSWFQRIQPVQGVHNRRHHTTLVPEYVPCGGLPCGARQDAGGRAASRRTVLNNHRPQIQYTSLYYQREIHCFINIIKIIMIVTMAPELSGKCASHDEGAHTAVIVRWAGDGSGYLDGLQVLLGSLRSSVSISSASFRR